MRLILDTNVVISGFVWGGKPGRLLNMGQEGEIKLFTSEPLLDELADVCFRERFKPLLEAKGKKAEDIYNSYEAIAVPVTPRLIGRTVRDPKDDVILGTALAARASIVVSGDNDLLVLHPYMGIKILNASDTLDYITSRERLSVIKEPRLRYALSSASLAA